MKTITHELRQEPLFAAICEGVRWWFNFDGPQVRKFETGGGGMALDDARRIALTYNFSRNIPTEDSRVIQIADAINAYRGTTHATLDERAAQIEATILHLHQEGATAKRLVSGTTKLVWFVAPENWTPFDRLAAAAVGVQEIDTLKRMRTYYATLDGIGFLDAARRIDALSAGTPFADVSGTRILDKLLMFRGDPDWTENTKPIALGLADAMSPAWRDELVRYAETVVHEMADTLHPILARERPA